MEAVDFGVVSQGAGRITVMLYDRPTTWRWDEDPPWSPRRIDMVFELTDDGQDAKPNPVSVTMHDVSGIAARDLSRFAWAQMLQVGWTRARISWHHTIDGARVARNTTERVRRKVRDLPAVRPGRRGHSEAHYAQIAARYQELVQSGSRDPGAKIAKEHDRSRNTVAGWIRTARERGLLPPAHVGRAG